MPVSAAGVVRGEEKELARLEAVAASAVAGAGTEALGCSEAVCGSEPLSAWWLPFLSGVRCVLWLCLAGEAECEAGGEARTSVRTVFSISVVCSMKIEELADTGSGIDRDGCVRTEAEAEAEAEAVAGRSKGVTASSGGMALSASSPSRSMKLVLGVMPLWGCAIQLIDSGVLICRR